MSVWYESPRHNIPVIDLLQLLWRGAQFGMFQRIREDVRRSGYVRTSAVGLPGEQWDANGWNIYFGVHPTNNRRPEYEATRNSDIAAINCLYAEFDAKDFGDKPAILTHIDTKWQNEGENLPYPSVMVDSGGGFHCYWLLDAPFAVTDDNRDQVKRWQAEWVTLWGADTGAKDLRRILRLPGTHNHKPGRNQALVHVVARESDIWSQQPLSYYLDYLPPAMPVAPRMPVEPVKISTEAGASRLEKYLSKVLESELEKVSRAPVGQRNTTLNEAAFNVGKVWAGVRHG